MNSKYSSPLDIYPDRIDRFKPASSETLHTVSDSSLFQLANALFLSGRWTKCSLTRFRVSCWNRSETKGDLLEVDCWLTPPSSNGSTPMAAPLLPLVARRLLLLPRCRIDITSRRRPLESDMRNRTNQSAFACLPGEEVDFFAGAPRAWRK